jgi:hypothetical protein
MILFLDHDLELAVNINFILGILEQLSGIKINLHKSRFWKCQGNGGVVQENFGNLECAVGSLPFRYVRVQIPYKRLLNKKWNPRENLFEKKLGCWQSKLLSHGDVHILFYKDTYRDRKILDF